MCVTVTCYAKSMQKKCLYCGEEFTAKRDSARFCKPAHKVAYNREIKQGEQPEQIQPEQLPRTESWMTSTDKLFEAQKPSYYTFSERKFSKVCSLSKWNLCKKSFDTHLELLRFCCPEHQQAALYILSGNRKEAAKLI